MPAPSSEAFSRRAPGAHGPEAGWASKENGDLLALAVDDCDVFVPVDRNLTFQQNVEKLQIGIVVLVARGNRLEDLMPLVPALQRAVETVERGRVVRLGVSPTHQRDGSRCYVPCLRTVRAGPARASCAPLGTAKRNDSRAGILENTMPKESAMRGVQFLVDDDGERTAVLIDLKKNAQLWKTSTTSPSRSPGPRSRASPWRASSGASAFAASVGDGELWRHLRPKRTQGARATEPSGAFAGVPSHRVTGVEPQTGRVQEAGRRR